MIDINSMPSSEDASEPKSIMGRPLSHPRPATAGKGMPQPRPSLFRSQANPDNINRYHRFDNDDYGFEPEHQGRGCLTRFLNCRCLGCGCLIFLVLFTLLAAFVIWQRPPYVWNPLKDWLNNGLTAVTAGQMTAGSAYADLNSQVSNFGVGTNTITITQQELQAILRDKLASNSLSDLNVDIQPNALKVYWNVDSEDPPLWMVLELNTQDQTRIKFDKIGTERIPLPAFLNDIATQMIISVLKFGNNKSGESNLLDVIFTAPANVQITNVKLEQDQLQLTVNVSNGLNNVFGN